MFYGFPSLLNRIKLRRITRKIHQAHAVRLTPQCESFCLMRRSSVQEQEQARVTRLQALYKTEHSFRIDFFQERVVFAPAVHNAYAMKFFASVIRFHYCGLAAFEPASRCVRFDDERAFVQAKRGSPLAFCTSDFSPCFFLNSSLARGELL